MEQFNADKARELKEAHMQSQIDVVLREVEIYANLGKSSISCDYSHFENLRELYERLTDLGFEISDIKNDTVKGFKVKW